MYTTPRHEDEMMSKVYVTQFDPKWNFSSLDQYGDVIFLTDREYAAEPAPGSYNNSIVNQIGAKLKEYVPGEDYIVMTGSAIPNMITGMWISDMAGPHKVLKWSNRSSEYELFKINA